MGNEQEEFEFRARAEKESEPKKRTPLEMVGRQVGLTARAALEGNPISAVGGMVGKAMGLDTPGALDRTLTRMGLPEPENTTERIVQAGAQGMAGGAGMTKLSEIGAGIATNPVVRGSLEAMSKGPATQIGAGAAAGTAAQGTAELGGGPVAQTLAGLVAAAAPGLAGKTAGAGSIRNPANVVKLETFKQANEAGYKFPPSSIESSPTRDIIGSVGGKAAGKQEVALHNQQVTNELAKKGAGVPKDVPLTEESLAQARNELAEPYRQVAKVSPQASTALTKWKDANAKAKLHWKDYERNQTAAAKEKFDHYDSVAETQQNIMETEAVRTGNPELIAKLREARVRIAQNYDVDRALNVGTGDVRAPVLGNILNKRGVKGMTGPLGIIAKTQQAFPQFLGEASKTPTPGVNQLASLGLGSIFGIEGYHSMGIKGGLAGAGVGLAMPQISRGARALSMSKLMQKPLSDQPGIPMSAIADYLAKQAGQ